MDVVFVLACGARNGKLTLESKRRVRKAVKIFKDIMIVSGGQTTRRGSIKVTEAELMKEYAVKLGVPEEKIILDFSTDTIQSAYSLSKFLKENDVSSVKVVTSWFHKKRVELIFEFLNEIEIVTTRHKVSPKVKERERKIMAITKKLINKDVSSLKRAMVISSLFSSLVEKGFLISKL